MRSIHCGLVLGRGVLTMRVETCSLHQAKRSFQLTVANRSSKENQGDDWKEWPATTAWAPVFPDQRRVWKKAGEGLTQILVKFRTKPISAVLGANALTHGDMVEEFEVKVVLTIALSLLTRIEDDCLVPKPHLWIGDVVQHRKPLFRNESAQTLQRLSQDIHAFVKTTVLIQITRLSMLFVNSCPSFLVEGASPSGQSSSGIWINLRLEFNLFTVLIILFTVGGTIVLRN